MRDQKTAQKYKNFFNEVIAGNFPSQGKEYNFQISEAYKIPNNNDQKGTASQYILVKIPKA